jgi:hypothetical protein
MTYQLKDTRSTLRAGRVSLEQQEPMEVLMSCVYFTIVFEFWMGTLC